MHAFSEHPNILIRLPRLGHPGFATDFSLILQTGRPYNKCQPSLFLLVKSSKELVEQKRQDVVHIRHSLQWDNHAGL